jgi:hypothetical protein
MPMWKQVDSENIPSIGPEGMPHQQQKGEGWVFESLSSLRIEEGEHHEVEQLNELFDVQVLMSWRHDWKDYWYYR